VSYIPFAPTNPATPQGLYFVPVTPCRVFDSRSESGKSGAFGPPVLSGGATRNIPVPQAGCGIPAGAAAYSVNITVVPQQPLAYLTAFPAGTAQPVVSTLNSFDGRVVANAAIVPAGANDAISIFVTNRTHVIVDINGYFSATFGPSSLTFVAVTPCRIGDTRASSGFSGPSGPPSLSSGLARSFAIASNCGIPTSARAVSANITAAPNGPLAYLSVYPSGQAFPNVSTLNSFGGQLRANAAIVPLGTDGAINLLASGQTDAIIDVNGYFVPFGGSRFFALPPCRLADTRADSGYILNFGPPFLVPLRPDGAVAYRTIRPSEGECAVPATARALSLNATAIPKGPLPFLTIYTTYPPPNASTLNSMEGQVVANAAIVSVLASFGQSFDVYASAPTDVVLDINGYFAH
jgi:hypothetical protein